MRGAALALTTAAWALLAGCSSVQPTPAGGAAVAPSISSLSASSTAAGSPPFTLVVNGSDFVGASAVEWNGVALATTYVSASQLTALVPASDLVSSGNFPVTVVTLGSAGGANSDSNSMVFNVTATNPVPSIAALSANATAQGGPAFTLTLFGSDFVPASLVNWNGSALSTTFVSASQLTALVPASDQVDAGTASVTVTSPAPGGGTSNSATFSVTALNPVPALTSISPLSAAVGSAALTLGVTGSAFVPGSAITWNGGALSTSFVSASQLTALVPAADLVAVTSASIGVLSPGPGGGNSNTLTFVVQALNPVPSAGSLTPDSVAAGSTPFTLSVSGSNFVAASTVLWNGTALSTTFVSAAQLSALVPASDLLAAGTASVTVVTPAPGGGASNVLLCTVTGTLVGPYIRQSATYVAYPGAGSNLWNVTLSNVLAGSAIYVVGVWPNFASTYPTMAVSDSTSTASNVDTYTLLGRYDDLTLFNHGIQGTQSTGHWYTANVAAGTYTINMSPTPVAWET